MGPLLFRCPVTASIINPQIETNEASIVTSRDGVMRVFCPHCKDWHYLPISAAFIEDRDGQDAAPLGGNRSTVPTLLESWPNLRAVGSK